MATLREYTVVVNGHETVMNLSEEDARRLGGKPTSGGESASSRDEPKAARAANKSRTAANKSGRE